MTTSMGTKQFCCCFEISKEAYVIAIISSICGILTLSYLSFWPPHFLEFYHDAFENVLHKLDHDISYIQNAYILYCLYAITFLFIVNDIALIFGLLKNSSSIMVIWLIVSGIRNLVRITLNLYFGHSVKCLPPCPLAPT